MKNNGNKISRGGRNILCLGLGAILIAVATTGVSLAVYHNSGDIYLDRSRPGYLPDQAEISDEAEQEKEYEFSKTGKIGLDDLEEYLKNLETEVQAIDAYEAPFSSEILSDKHLGITEGEAEQGVEN